MGQQTSDSLFIGQPVVKTHSVVMIIILIVVDKDDVGDMSAYLLKHVIGDPLHENDTGETGADEFLEYIRAPQLVVRLGG